MSMPLSLGQPAGEPRRQSTFPAASHALARMGRAVRSNRKATVGTVLNKTHNYVPARLHQEYLNDI